MKIFDIDSNHVADGLSRLAAAVGKRDDQEQTAEKYGYTISTETFVMHPYCWCGHKACPWCHKLLDDETANEFGSMPGTAAPNFWYKPTDLKIWWYKYIGRSMEANREFSDEEWRAIESACFLSLIEANNT